MTFRTKPAGISTFNDQIRITVFFFGWLHVAAGLLLGSKGGRTDRTMRGDHLDMTLRRLWLETVRKPVGWIMQLLTHAFLISGALLVDAPTLVLVVLGALVAEAVVFPIGRAHAARWVDTCVAIWGHSALLLRPSQPAAAQALTAICLLDTLHGAKP